MKAIALLLALVACSHLAGIAAMVGHGRTADGMLVVCLGLSVAAIAAASRIATNGLVPSYNYSGEVTR